MCGIAGFISPNHFHFDFNQVIHHMTDAIKHRGPDHQGVWIDPQLGIALGHQRLSILDLSTAGQQPMHCNHQRYTIVFNGEIYNFPTLKTQLNAQGYVFHSHTDTEVLLALITRYGIEDMLAQLSGMFAFAIWDRYEQKLHLARDRIGEKPLYYGSVQGHFMFASELKALQQHPHFTGHISHDSLSAFLHYGYIPSPNSIYQNIYKLPPASYLSLTLQQLQRLPVPQKYWQAMDKINAGIQQPLKIPPQAAVDLIHQQLHSIVKQRMLADVPVGVFLSGGIDSSLIAALMQASNTQAIQSFTIGFHEHHFNEAQYAKQIAKHLKTNHTELYINATQALNIIPKLTHHFDEPFADSSAIPTLLLAQLTQQSVKVALSGDGGDELFGGYRRYILTHQFWKYLQYCPLLLRQLLQSLLNRPQWGHKLQKISKILNSNNPAALYQQLIAQWLNPADVLHSQIHTHPPIPILMNLNHATHLYEHMMATDTLTYLPDDILVKTDRSTMAFSLETRSPFLDHELFELIWQLPNSYKIQQQTKWLLREILKQYLPPSLFHRPKMGFGIPLAQWLKTSLKDWGEQLLNPKTIESQGLLNSEYVQKIWQEHQHNQRNWHHQLWTILMLQSWLQHHYHRDTV